MGKVFVPAETSQLAYLAEGVHEPLISEKLFKEVQRVIYNRIEKRKQPKVTRKREELPLLPLPPLASGRRGKLKEKRKQSTG